MNGWNAGQGTGSNSALTKKAKHGSSLEMGYDHSMKKTAAFHQEFTWADAIKNDPNLSKLVAERDKYKKGTDEYAAAQNRVNKAYENAKRHNVTSTTETKRGGKKEITTTVTPGIDTKVTKTKRDKHGNIIKTKTDTDVDEYVEETYDEQDSKEKQKRGKDKEFDTEDDKKKKRKKYKDTKFGQTGVGQLFVSKKNKKKKPKASSTSDDPKSDPFSKRRNY